jgi:hypothetical protein
VTVSRTLARAERYCVAFIGNGFSNNATNHIVVSDGSLVTVSGNDFGNISGTVETTGSANMNAQGNWWGQAAGPNAGQIVESGTGTIDATNPLITDPFPGFGT